MSANFGASTVCVWFIPPERSAAASTLALRYPIGHYEHGQPRVSLARWAVWAENDGMMSSLSALVDTTVAPIHSPS
jgi:hypothetical protein